MRFRAVIFDLDDTIHDKSATLRAVARHLFVDHGPAGAGVNENSWNTEFVRLNNLRIGKPEVFAMLANQFRLHIGRLRREETASLQGHSGLPHECGGKRELTSERSSRIAGRLSVC
jgi:phosphoglycolate phosphatase-like HAD superfamily hydrolase